MNLPLSKQHIPFSRSSGLLEAIRGQRQKREAQIALDRDIEKAGVSLSSFTKAAWHVLEPGQPYKHGWHIDAISEHLEAITAGEITRLLINVPPGTMKSLSVGVMWPAWEWGPKGRPHTRYLGTSHSHPLAIRDNLKMRRLVASDWYQERWGGSVRLMHDQNAKLKFENDATGFREAMAFTSLTGSRGDRVLIDDPLSVDAASSDTQREAVNETFREAVPTRLNNPDRSAIVVVMQRLHENDVSGLILSKDFGYEHLMLPMEFEPERKCYTSIGFEDPRTEDGELLFPARFPREVVERDKKVMGSYATAGQFQQRPAPREGGMFKRAWFRFVRAVPTGTSFVRGWDLAASIEDGSAYTAGVKMGRCPDKRYIITNAVRDRLSAGGVESLIVNTATSDGFDCRISLPQDPGQAGKAQAGYFVRQLAGYAVRATPESGDKATRAAPLSAQAEAGNVDILITGDPAADAWIEPFLDELCVFPNGKYKDQTDAATRAFDELAQTTGYTLEEMRKAYS
ncbi:phage terminase large subunit [Pelagibacterium sp. H642]|uniref:phage terminase large subunit n=1 Tax=Pelagibacterium sp. H642 TaxID=1881069 RepID=UPI00281594AD|nr:phage terminase large subunit [Pelagibacterium sp. H642]WMT90138.1 phage terminase large subunit [Pelagibacterium sp. H642]